MSEIKDVDCKKCDKPRHLHDGTNTDHRFTEPQPPALIVDCDCGTSKAKHTFGNHESCEYFKHHCEFCHEMHICTLKECDDTEK